MSGIAAPRRRRGRGWIVFAVILVVLIGAFVAVDFGARAYAANLIDEKVHSALAIPADQKVDVTVGGVSVIAQLLTGKLEQVDVAAADLAVGPLRGDVALTAKGLPLDQSRPIDSARLQFSAGDAELEKLAAALSAGLGLPISSVGVSGGAVQVAAKFSVLGVSIPVAVSFTPSAVDGQLGLEPQSITVSGKTLTPGTLGNTLGGAGSTLTKTQTICVATLLPKGFTLDSIAVHGDRLVLAVRASAVTLDSELLSTPGTCPGT